MTVESTLAVDEHARAPEEPVPTYLVGRLISLRFVASALRRSRKVWLGLAVVGLLAGAAYHVVVPIQYQAAATLYLAHLPGSDDNVDMANDLALLRTSAVGEQAVKLLGEPDLAASKLLGKAPGTADSVNVMTVTVSGPTKTQAVRRVDDLATAFLAFRSAQVRRQTAATTDALQRQIRALNTQVDQLTAQINGLDPTTQGADLDTLVSDRSSDASQVVTLEQTVQQDQLDDLAVANGSRVLTPGAAVPTSTAKVLGLDGITGLVAGLAAGVALVALRALLSERVRSRAEVTALLGTTVALSVRRRRHRRASIGRRRTERMVVRPGPEVRALADFLGRRCEAPGAGSSLLVVAADRHEIPAAAMAVVASRLASLGRSVLVADLTKGRTLAGLMGVIRSTAGRAGPDDAGELSLFAGSAGPDGAVVGVTDPTQSGSDIVLTLATLDPGVGAWHLDWAEEAVVVVTAGRSGAQRLSAIGELLRAAGLCVTTAVLLDADDDDQTVGLVIPATPPAGRALEVVPTASTRP